MQTIGEFILFSAHSPPMLVSTEYDVIVIRQEVRQTARALGMSLIQQAKIAAAVSSVARGLLAFNRNTTITMRTTDHGLRPALEIVCISSIDPRPDDTEELEQTLHFGETRLLVDESDLAMVDDNALLTLRIWLGPRRSRP